MKYLFIDSYPVIFQTNEMSELHSNVYGPTVIIKMHEHAS